MQLQDINLNQIIIVLLFLGFLLILQQLIKKNKFNLQGQFHKKRRINLIDDFGISPSERIRLFRVDNKEYLYFYSKGNSPVICPHEIDPNLRNRYKNSLREKKTEASEVGNNHLRAPQRKKSNILSEAISVARRMNPQLGFKK